jgi:serine/threonine-protein kinase
MDSEVRQHIEKVCESEVFRNTPRLRDLLVFLTSRSLNNDGHVLKETVVGVEFFGRDPSYDPKKDPIVRVEAHRLRRRLADYYNQEGFEDAWRIELRKGTYAPAIRKRNEVAAEWRLAVLVDAPDELTAEGLTVELVHKLGELHGITVFAPRSSVATHGATDAIRTLGANAILECEIDGTNLQARLSRVDASGLKAVGTFDNVIQPAVEALRRFVATSLGAGAAQTKAPAKRRVVDRESYQLYLAGRAWFHRWSPDNLAQAAAYFEKVVERCPDYAPAYAGLADIQVLLGYWHVTNARPILERGRAYALRALELDPDCADAYCSLAAFDATLDRNWDGSEANFRRALEANSSHALALNWLSIIALIPRRRFEEAVDAVFAAYDLDPASPEIGNEIVWVRINCRQFEEAAEQGRQIVALHPTFLEAYWSLGLAESALEHHELARTAFDRAEELAPDVPFTLALRSYVEGMGGNSRRAREYLNRLRELGKSSPVRELYYCWAHTGLGELDQAMQHLRRAIDVADPIALYVDVFFPFDRLKGHRQYERIRQQQRLAP